MTDTFNYYGIILFSDTHEVENNYAFKFIEKD